MNEIIMNNNEWNNVICGNMEEPRDYHTKWSKSDKLHMISLISGI